MAKNDTPAGDSAPPADAPALDLSVLANDEVATPQDVATPVNVPQEVKDFVHRAHGFWKTTPKKWRKVALADEKAIASVVEDASKYAKSVGLTFRVRKQPNATVLVFKVTDAVRKNGGNAPTDPTAVASNSASTSLSDSMTSKNDG